QMAAMSWAPISIRAQYISRLYLTPDIEEAKGIIERYGIQYVYVGELERKTYPGLDESKFDKLGRVVFESHGSKLFQLSAVEHVFHNEPHIGGTFREPPHVPREPVLAVTD